MIDTRAKVRFNRCVGRDTFLMGMAAPDILEAAVPGQFVMIGTGKGLDPLLRRPFSISGAEGQTLLILYRVVGRGTERLSQVAEGEELPCLGPLGRGFALPAGGGPVLAVAGGIGIAPLLFLLQSLKNREAELMVGCRTGSERVPEALFDLPAVSVSLSTDDGTIGRKGLVTELLEERLRDLRGTDAALYACGPRPMLRVVASLAQRAAVSCQVSLEAHMACGVGACQGCAVAAAPGIGRAYLHVCREGPVFDASEVAWGGTDER